MNPGAVEDDGTLPAGRVKLVTVLAAAGDVVTVDDAVQALGLSRGPAAKWLSRWTRQRWLRRVGPGVYVPVPLDMLDLPQVVTDPWVLVPALFGPAYVGGHTAAEYWGLTDQMFRDTVVYTTRPRPVRVLEPYGIRFTPLRVRRDRIFGTCSIRRGPQTSVEVSDLHRTVIDLLAAPQGGGGIAHVASCLGEYLRHRDGDPGKLIEYAERIGNGALFKRLGLLAEQAAADPELIAACRDRLTQGYARLSPGISCSRLVTRWRVRVPDWWSGARVGA